MHADATRHLAESDPRLGEWIERIGPIDLPQRAACEPYLALLESVAHQQLAGAAARAIWGRVLTVFEGSPTPARLLAVSDAQLRAAGLSRAKSLAMRDIAAKALAGELPDGERILGLAEADLYRQLTRIRGVGPWTVDMLMIFTLRRPDVMPGTDFGVRKGLQLAHRKRAMPTPRQVLQAAERWRPYRTTAALYLWRIAAAPAAPGLAAGAKAPPRAAAPKRRVPRRRPVTS
jgi:DNA-3-methyladenine glycosylase II